MAFQGHPVRRRGDGTCRVDGPRLPGTLARARVRTSSAEDVGVGTSVGTGISVGDRAKGTLLLSLICKRG